jgi:hypothetical protein
MDVLNAFMYNLLNIFRYLHLLNISVEEACTVWCYKRSGGSKSRGWTFPDGTACQSHRSRYGKSMYCISGRCEVRSTENVPLRTHCIFSFHSYIKNF